MKKKYFAYLTALILCASMIKVPCAGAASDIDSKSGEPVSSVPVKPESENEPVPEESKEQEDENPSEEKVDETKWHMSLHKAASAILNDEGDSYKVYIENPGGSENGGADKWDVQFRIKGLSIKEGHKYKMTYEISADSDGYYYSKIGNPGAETVGAAVAGEAWHNQFGTSTVRSLVKGYIIKDKKVDYSSAWTMQEISYGDTISVVSEFEGIADLPEAEWAFFLGGKGDATPTGCFEKNTTIYFSNLLLVDMTTGETLVKDKNPITDKKGSGDLDGDGKTDLTDLTTLSLHLLGDKPLADSVLKSADVTGDDIIDIADLAALKGIIMHVVPANEIIPEDLKLPEDEILFVNRSLNLSWGYQDMGIFVDSDGAVYSFDFSDTFDSPVDQEPKKYLDEKKFLEALYSVRTSSDPKEYIDMNVLRELFYYSTKINKNAEFKSSISEFVVCDAGQGFLYTHDLVEDKLVMFKEAGNFPGSLDDSYAQKLILCFEEKVSKVRWL